MNKFVVDRAVGMFTGHIRCQQDIILFVTRMEIPGDVGDFAVIRRHIRTESGGILKYYHRYGHARAHRGVWKEPCEAFSELLQFRRNLSYFAVARVSYQVKI